MKLFKVTGLACLVLTGLAGCGNLPQTTEVSRTQSHVSSASLEISAEETALIEQANALRDMTATLKRRAAIKWAALGAAAGCGLSVVAGAGKSTCLRAAVAGGAIGGAAGLAKAEQQARQRMELVSLSRTLPSIRSAGSTSEGLKNSTDAVLSLQDAELAELRRAVAAGSMTPKEYDARLSQVRALRAELAEALTLSAQQVRDARELFEQAEAEGQEGLAWYLHAIRAIEDDTLSARAEVDLL